MSNATAFEARAAHVLETQIKRLGKVTFFGDETTGGKNHRMPPMV
jgi:hypothetical protein